MRVRTVSAFVSLASVEDIPEGISGAVTLLTSAKDAYEAAGLEVQTLRVLTNGFEEYLGEVTLEALVAASTSILACAKSLPGLLVNVGPAQTPEGAALIPGLVQACPSVTASANIPAIAVGSGAGAVLVPDMAMADAAAGVILALSTDTAGGEGNFNFAATANARPGIPYFPAGFAPPPSGTAAPTLTWAVGLENPDVVVAALAKGAAAGPPGSHAAWTGAAAALVSGMESALLEVQAVAQGVEAATGVPFDGIDASVAPAVDGPSLVAGYEALLGEGGFGGPGTLAVCRLITGAIAGVKARGAAKVVGYSGLMLPPLEDTGLAARMADGAFSVGDLLSFSSVCGLGLDTVPVAGDTPRAAIAGRIADMVALAYKLEKPLSCRLFPVPGAGVGEATAFANPHMCDSVVMQL